MPLTHGYSEGTALFDSDGEDDCVTLHTTTSVRAKFASQPQQQQHTALGFKLAALSVHGSVLGIPQENGGTTEGLPAPTPSLAIDRCSATWDADSWIDSVAGRQVHATLEATRALLIRVEASVAGTDFQADAEQLLAETRLRPVHEQYAFWKSGVSVLFGKLGPLVQSSDSLRTVFEEIRVHSGDDEVRVLTKRTEDALRVPRGSWFHVEPSFASGDEVYLCRLASASHLNGASGVLEYWSPDRWRWSLIMFDGRTTFVKTDNLTFNPPLSDDSVSTTASTPPVRKPGGFSRWKPVAPVLVDSSTDLGKAPLLWSKGESALDHGAGCGSYGVSTTSAKLVSLVRSSHSSESCEESVSLEPPTLDCMLARIAEEEEADTSRFFFRNLGGFTDEANLEAPAMTCFERTYEKYSGISLDRCKEMGLYQAGNLKHDECEESKLSLRARLERSRPLGQKLRASDVRDLGQKMKLTGKVDSAPKRSFGQAYKSRAIGVQRSLQS